MNLQIQHLTLTHKQDGRELLRDFSFVLNPGDRAALIGEEGDGKSTLLKWIADPALVESYAEYSGRIIKNGLRPGYLAQELTEKQKETPVFRLTAGADGPGLSAAARRLRLSPGLLRSGRPAGTLSGGEKVKLQLALILAREPDFLLLDEPSNDLDLETLQWLETFLNTCGIPALYVSHDETLLENTANVIVHLEQLRRKTVPRCTVARMSYRPYVKERLRLFERQEQLAHKEKSEYEKQQERFRRLQSGVEYRQAHISRGDPHGGKMIKRKMKSVKSMGRRFERQQKAMTELPDSEDAILIQFGENTSIPGGKTVLDFRRDTLEAGGRVLARGVALHVTGPERIGIIGRNGAGKTTLLRQIAGELLPRPDVKAAYMPQDYSELLGGGETPVEFLSVSGEQKELTKIRTFLGSMKYTADEMMHGVRDLSGGQKAKLLLLKMILGGCNVLILDEPTRNFSPLSGPVVRSVLRSFGGAVISVSHDRKFLSEVCGKIYRLSETGLEPFSFPEAKKPPLYKNKTAGT